MLIFFNILKIIGIVLLAILGVILFLLCIILFVPVRYKFFVLKTKESDEYKVKGSISWFLHFLNIHINYPSDELYKVKITFFKILPKKNKVNSDKENSNINVNNIENNNNAESNVVEENFVNRDDSKIEVTGIDNLCNIDENIDVHEIEDEKYIDENKQNIFEKLINILNSKIESIKLTLKNVYDKIIDIKRNINYYIDILKSDSFHKAYDISKTELNKLLISLKPKSIKGTINFGAEDPALTAQVFGLYTIVHTFYFKKLYFNPCFEEEIIDIDVTIKGYIRVITVVIIALKLLFNKNIKYVMKQFKKES